jgi:hypothetical protein
MFYGQYLLINKVQCQRHEFFEQHQNDIQTATRYEEFRDQFCTGLADPQIKQECIVLLEEYCRTFVKTVPAPYQHILCHATLI